MTLCILRRPFRHRAPPSSVVPCSARHHVPVGSHLCATPAGGNGDWSPPLLFHTTHWVSLFLVYICTLTSLPVPYLGRSHSTTIVLELTN